MHEIFMTRMHTTAIAAFVAAMLATSTITGCSDNQSRSSSRAAHVNSRSTVDSAGSQNKPERADRGVLIDGAERSEWLVEQTGGKSINIIEQSRTGDERSFLRTFEFAANGELERMTETRSGIIYPGNQSPMTIRTQLDIDFSNSAPVAHKTVDGSEAPVRDFELDNIRNHAALLWREAGKR